VEKWPRRPRSSSPARAASARAGARGHARAAPSTVRSVTAAHPRGLSSPTVRHTKGPHSPARRVRSRPLQAAQVDALPRRDRELRQLQVKLLRAIRRDIRPVAQTATSTSTPPGAATNRDLAGIRGRFRDLYYRSTWWRSAFPPRERGRRAALAITSSRFAAEHSRRSSALGDRSAAFRVLFPGNVRELEN